jgi:hypothetical protein
VDSREALLGFKPGLGALAARVPGLRLVPLAIEYTFWDERLPETLLRIGEPLRVPAGTSTVAATEELEVALAAVMAELKAAAIARDASAFTSLLSGARGTGGLYGFGRRLRAWVTRKPVALDHTRREGPEESQ